MNKDVPGVTGTVASARCPQHREGWGPPHQSGNGLSAEPPERGGPVFVTSVRCDPRFSDCAGLQFRPSDDLPVTPGRVLQPTGLQRGPVIG
jgi:hypothetical protein